VILQIVQIDLVVGMQSLQFAHSFTKLPQPRHSSWTFTVFESSCHLLPVLPVLIQSL